MGRFCRNYQSKWFYLVLSLIITVTITTSYKLPAEANRWLDIIRQGIQILQISNLSDAEEVKLGESINETLLSGNEVQLLENTQINGYIAAIGARLAQSSDRPEIPYTFQVISDESVNAFATMGGFVYINTGLIKTATNEAELASVVAHEIGHIAAKHALQRLRQQAIAQGLMNATGLDESTAVNIGIEVAFQLPRSREDELEADQLGLNNLKRAGYAPIAMVNFMQTLLQYSGSAPSILSTHPATSERIELLEDAIDPQTANFGDGLNQEAYLKQIQPLL